MLKRALYLQLLALRLRWLCYRVRDAQGELEALQEVADWLPAQIVLHKQSIWRWSQQIQRMHDQLQTAKEGQNHAEA